MNLQMSKSETLTLIKDSDKVSYRLTQQPKGMGKKWLAEKLGISRPTLDLKLATNNFNDSERGILRKEGLL